MSAVVLGHNSQAFRCLNFYQITWPFSIVESLPKCSLRISSSLEGGHLLVQKGVTYDEISLENECYVKQAALW